MARSDGLLHAEENLLAQIERDGLSLDNIDHLYSEYSPCTRSEHLCNEIASKVGDVTYHVPYGIDGSREMRDRMIDDLFGG